MVSGPWKGHSNPSFHGRQHPRVGRSLPLFSGVVYSERSRMWHLRFVALSRMLSLWGHPIATDLETHMVPLHLMPFTSACQQSPPTFCLELLAPWWTSRLQFVERISWNSPLIAHTLNWEITTALCLQQCVNVSILRILSKTKQIVSACNFKHGETV